MVLPAGEGDKDFTWAVTSGTCKATLQQERIIMATTEKSVLSDQLLARCAERAPIYDRENRFFDEDFAELRDVGYLRLNVPKELGGLGLLLPDVCREQRRLAYHAHATALAVNMHLYWTGVAADLWRAGDTSLEWMLKGAVNGEVFAAGHAESGNDMPLLLSTTKAERVDGGYRFTGHKSFGSLTPVWTYLGMHGMDTSNAAAPKIVHAFMPRASEGYTIKETWDTLGMRATRSDDTILEGAFVPDKYVGRIVPAGQADLFVLAIFAWAESTFGSIYLGVADRARELAIQTAHKRTSLAMTRSMAYNPEIQHAAAEMVLAMEPASAYIDKIAQDWSDGPDMSVPWPMHFVAAKHA